MSRTSILVCLGLLISLSACGDDDGNAECTISDGESCACTGMPTGIMICDPDGDTWLGCDCPPAPNNGSPVTVGSLMWQTTLGPSSTPAAAVTYCEGYEEDQHTDWRLPTKAEFETFFSGCSDIGNGYIRCTGACNNSSFCTSAPETWYRTATAVGTGEHYIVHTGRNAFTPLSDDYSVSTICVRDAN